MWNREWIDFARSNSSASPQQIEQFMHAMIDGFRLRRYAKYIWDASH